MSAPAPMTRTVDQLPAQPMPSRTPSRWWGANADADARIVELERLRAEAKQDAKAISGGVAKLIERYHVDAADADQRQQITNLASLLRHVTAYTVALSGEIEHYAAEAADALNERDEWRERALAAGWMS